MTAKTTTLAITAAEARQLAIDLNARPTKIQSHLDRIHAQIREAANEGRKSLGNPLAKLWNSLPDVEEMGAIWAALKVEGYSVTWQGMMPLILTISWD